MGVLNAAVGRWRARSLAFGRSDVATPPAVRVRIALFGAPLSLIGVVPDRQRDRSARYGRHRQRADHVRRHDAGSAGGLTSSRASCGFGGDPHLGRGRCLLASAGIDLLGCASHSSRSVSWRLEPCPPAGPLARLDARIGFALRHRDLREFAFCRAPAHDRTLAPGSNAEFVPRQTCSSRLARALLRRRSVGPSRPRRRAPDARTRTASAYLPVARPPHRHRARIR